MSDHTTKTDTTTHLGRNLNILGNTESKNALYTANASFSLTFSQSDCHCVDAAIKSHLYNEYAGHEYVTFSKERVSRAVMHRHDYFELLYVMEGEITVRIERELHGFHPGEVCLINRNMRHTEKNDTDYSVVFLHISRDFIEHLLPAVKESEKKHSIFSFLQNNLQNRAQYKKECLCFTPENEYAEKNTLLLSSYLDDMKNELTQQVTGYRFFLYGLVLRFFDLLQDTRYYSAQHIQLNSSAEELFDRMSLLIEDSHGKITRNELSRILGYHGHYLNRIMKKYTGLTITSYIQQYRMKEAAKLLISTNTSISKILSSLGFENRTYFYRIFEEYYGMTPQDYRDSANT